MAAKSDIDRQLEAAMNRSPQIGNPKADTDPPLPPPHGYQSLDLAKKNGERWGFPYSCLASQHYDKEKGVITLRFTFQEVTIKGRALDEIYQRLLTRAVGCVCEQSANAKVFGTGNDHVIDSIIVLTA